MSRIVRIGMNYYNTYKITHIYVNKEGKNKWAVEVYGLRPSHLLVAIGSGGTNEQCITWKFNQEPEAHDFVKKHFNVHD